MDLFRVYDDVGADGYPVEWHKGHRNDALGVYRPAIKDLVREQAGNRCVRCGHPYMSGEHGSGEWTPCDECCTHGGPTRLDYDDYPGTGGARSWVEAQWRILTVHHLNGVKADCRWWNLAALCQRCHLSIQGKVVMGRVWPWPHSDWFKPYAAGWYASAYLGEELTHAETMARLDELLALEQAVA